MKRLCGREIGIIRLARRAEPAKRNRPSHRARGSSAYACRTNSLLARADQPEAYQAISTTASSTGTRRVRRLIGMLRSCTRSFVLRASRSTYARTTPKPMQGWPALITISRAWSQLITALSQSQGCGARHSLALDETLAEAHGASAFTVGDRSGMGREPSQRHKRPSIWVRTPRSTMDIGLHLSGQRHHTKANAGDETSAGVDRNAEQQNQLGTATLRRTNMTAP